MSWEAAQGKGPACLSGSTGGPAFVLQWGHTMKNCEVLRRALVLRHSTNPWLRHEQGGVAGGIFWSRSTGGEQGQWQEANSVGTGTGQWQQICSSVSNKYISRWDMQGLDTWLLPVSLTIGKRGCDSCLLRAVLCFQCPCLVCWQGRGLLPQAPSGVLSSASGCTAPLWPLLSPHSLEQSQSWLLLGEQVREECWQKWSVPAGEQPDLLAARWRSCT